MNTNLRASLVLSGLNILTGWLEKVKQMGFIIKAKSHLLAAKGIIYNLVSNNSKSLVKLVDDVFLKMIR